ncbi:hypothetical protein [Caudoviricetes sp.]|nr:hypothetical protein [Caudoviricetes sp.]UOF79123.1 hypothetical protein [Caudoviricetes sp.]
MINSNEILDEYVSTYSNPPTPLTKREYFAALALQGLCANTHTDEDDVGMIADMAVHMADALIKKLNKDK